MFRLKVFKTQIDFFFFLVWREKTQMEDEWSAVYPTAPPCRPRPSIMLLFLLLHVFFLLTSATFQQRSIPSCSHHAASQKLPYFNRLWFADLPLCSVFASSELLNQIKCLHAHFLWFLCDRSEDKIGCFSCDELCQKHLFCHLQWLKLERVRWKW